MSRSSIHIADHRVLSSFTRLAAVLGALLTMSGTVTGTLRAQPATSGAAARVAPSWEMVFSSGALVPTGALRARLQNAPLSTAQLAYVIGSRVAVTSTVGWARSRDLLSDGDPKLSVFTYDVGMEARAPRWLAGERLALTPFAGGGAGGRSFKHRGRDLDATHAMTGFLSAGGELTAGRARVRLEVRDYLTGMTPLIGPGKREARNDVMLLAGLRVVRKRGATD